MKPLGAHLSARVSASSLALAPLVLDGFSAAARAVLSHSGHACQSLAVHQHIAHWERSQIHCSNLLQAAAAVAMMHEAGPVVLSAGLACSGCCPLAPCRLSCFHRLPLELRDNDQGDD